MGRSNRRRRGGLIVVRHKWGRNAPRLARRCVERGQLIKLAGGLYGCPRETKFGQLLPSDEAVLGAFLDGSPYVFTGPERWNQLGLGSTAMSATRLVYNTKRSGEFTFGKKRFHLRRVAFPRKPTAEWFVIDLLENHSMAGVDLEGLESNLRAALEAGRFDVDRLLRTAKQYGTLSTQALVRRTVPSRQDGEWDSPTTTTPFSS